MKNYIISALLILASFNAYSTESNGNKIIIGQGSYHLVSKDRVKLNEINPSIGVEINDISVVYIHKNSWNKKSFYVTYAPDYKVNEYIELSMNVGFATGYKCSNYVRYKGEKWYTTQNICNDWGVLPMVAATIDYSPLKNNFNISTSIAPTVIMFSINYEFD